MNREGIIKDFLALLRAQLQMEYRGQQLTTSGAVFVVATSFTSYITLQTAQRSSQLGPMQWNLLFWVLFLFMSLYVGGATATIRRGRVMFYFLLSDPLVLWAAKLVYMSILLFILGSLLFGLQLMWMGNPLLFVLRFWAVLAWASVGFAVVLTTLSLLVARAEASSLLFAILALPLLLPLCVFCVRASQGCMPQLSIEVGLTQSMWPLVGFVLWILSLTLLLFPYIWKN